MDALGPLLPFVLILLAFYLLIIRPSRNRTKAQQRLVAQLSVGTQVMTTSGLHAEVESVEDDTVGLLVAPGVTLRYARAAVARVLPAEEPEDRPEQAEQQSSTGSVPDAREAAEPGTVDGRHSSDVAVQDVAVEDGAVEDGAVEDGAVEDEAVEDVAVDPDRSGRRPQ